MTNVSQFCILVVLCYAAQATILIGSDFFCRDPDTGKLHATNTTWASTTFCGNYTCKLRRKNLTASEYPFRQFSVTNMSDINDKIFDRGNNEFNDMNQQVERDNTNFTKKMENNEDRYLTDHEIKTISEILRLVKKSDLDAIIEIYKLAQDIYKDIDDNGIDNFISETGVYNEQDKIKKMKADAMKAFNTRAHSYWNSAAYTKNKAYELQRDMDSQGTNILTSASNPQISNSYFTGSLFSTDFRKLPYYYPVSTVQRVPLYMQPHVAGNLPCTLKNSSKQKSPKDIQPTFYLPYPFSYIHHHNTSSNPTFFYRRNYDKSYDVYTRNKVPYIKSYLSNIPNTVSSKPNVIKKSKENTEIKATLKKEIPKITSKRNSEENQLPDWQTSPLAIDVLEEVRAHIQDKAKLVRPLRKNIKLERVGKIIQLPRNKREAAKSHESKRDLALYEVFLEKIICDSNDTTPGYFRYGNLSQPFPACCPERIRTR